MNSMIDRIINKKFLNNSALKLIAIICMTIDHATVLIWHKYITYFSTLCYNQARLAHNLYDIGRNIGRLAFPIFCFCIVEGFFHTKNLAKYMLRLFILGLISEVPFDLVRAGAYSDFSGQNVFFTLLLGLICISLIDYCAKSERLNSVLFFPLIIILTAGIAYFSYLCKSDYSFKGIIAITLMYLLYYDHSAMCVAGAVAFFYEPYSMLAFIPIFFYNKERGNIHKYLFYAFYPSHMIILYIVVTYLLPTL